VVSRALESFTALREVLIHTGQHFDYNMSGIFFDELQMREPDHHLGVNGDSQGAQTGRMLSRIEEVLVAEQPDMVLLFGDTNSTLAGALAAAKLNIPITHIEAGLRSFDRRMPEEINRVVTDHVSTLLFAPTQTAVRQLHTEGITSGVHFTGDVMLDSILSNLEKAESKSQILSQLGLSKGNYSLVTVHRSENTVDSHRLTGIVDALTEIAESDVLIWPLHPRTRLALSEFNIISSTNKIRMLEPLPYLDLLVLQKNARVVLTDSGGIQKEACWFGVPCVTLRDQTEWVETVELGWNQLAGAETHRILEAFGKVSRGKAVALETGAAVRVARHIAEYLLEPAVVHEWKSVEQVAQA
jgi:UDP-N-acetylglucosamine 2-epimerase